jgi:hypothetical protein
MTTPTDDVADRLIAAVDRLVARFDQLHRDIIETFDRRTAADSARTDLIREIGTAALASPLGRALIAVVLVRVMFGSAADALLVALVSRATGIDVGAP